jgi:hypothetical protein
MRMRAALLAIVVLVAANGHAGASGFATYFANLTATGTVSISSGVHKAERTGPGVYDVTFVRLVNDCSFTVSVTGATPGFASANRTTGRTVTVSTFLKNGVAANLPSNIILVCGP